MRTLEELEVLAKNIQHLSPEIMREAQAESLFIVLESMAKWMDQTEIRLQKLEEKK